MLKRTITACFLVMCVVSPMVAKNSRPSIGEKVYLRVKNKSLRTLQVKEGLFVKTTKILYPEQELTQYQTNSMISNLQISYKRNGRFIRIPDHRCQSKFFLATYEVSVKENKDNVPDEEDGHIDLNIPPFCKLSKETQKYFNEQSG